MGKGIESELKYALEQREYEALVRRFPGASRVVQTNYYFDVPSTLRCNRLKIGIRIRLTRGRPPVMTVKAPAPKPLARVAGHRVRREVEAELDPRTARRILRGDLPLAALDVEPTRLLKTLLNARTLSSLSLLGHSKNTRIEARYGRALVLEIDRFELFDRTDYELEVETTRPTETDREVKGLLASLGIPARARSRSKLARFLSAYVTRRDRNRAAARSAKAARRTS